MITESTKSYRLKLSSLLICLTDTISFQVSGLCIELLQVRCGNHRLKWRYLERMIQRVIIMMQINKAFNNLHGCLWQRDDRSPCDSCHLFCESKCISRRTGLYLYFGYLGISVIWHKVSSCLITFSSAQACAFAVFRLAGWILAESDSYGA